MHLESKWGPASEMTSTTALARYALLEAEARYFDGRSARPRDVVLGFRERSLIIRGFDDVVIAHWPLASLRALGEAGAHPVLIAPGRESEERLSVNDSTMIEAIAEVCPDLHHRPVGRKGVGRVIVWGAGAVVSVLLIVFVLMPALAGHLAQMIPPEREQALGDAVARQVSFLLGMSGEDNDGLCTGSDGRVALAQMSARLSAPVDLPFPLRVEVVDHPLVNAIALPGGRIMVFRGLIDAAGNPEEIAGVLAHEIGHVVHRDPTTMALRAAGTAGIFGLLLGDIFGATALAAASEAVLNASYQREAEARADEAALEILAEAGLPSRPFAAFFERLKEENGEVPPIFRYLSSHPELGTRAERAATGDRIGDSAFEPALSDRDWIALQGICGGPG